MWVWETCRGVVGWPRRASRGASSGQTLRPYRGLIMFDLGAKGQQNRVGYGREWERESNSERDVQYGGTSDMWSALSIYILKLS